MNRFFKVAFSGTLLLSALAFIASAQPVAPDPAYRIGKLPNGLTYYIRHNEEPKQRASFYIIQNVGALLENDDQNGLAHFLEHMAFNGTKNFPDKGIISSLEKHGVAFGRNINAYTAFTETVYNLSDVPSTDQSLVDSCLLVLHDWSHYLTLSDKEIDAERGVITEEWRTRRTASFRMQREMFPVLFKDSKYAVRDVIGDSAIIKHFKYETLRNFYHDWYRTDLQCIAIVGDINVDAVEKSVKDLFTPIPAVETAKPRLPFEIPFHKETLFVLAKDKEAPQYSISIYIKHPETKPESKDLGYYREQYVIQLFNAMMRDRITELLQKGVPPFVSGSVNYGGMVRGYTMTGISAVAKPDQGELALKAIYTEAQRLVRYGFTQGELDRAKSNLLTQIESQWKQKDKIRNDSYVNDIQGNFLSNEPLTSIDFDWKAVQKLMPTVTVEELSAKAKQWIVPENRVIIVMGPDKEGTKLISESEALAVLKEVEASEIKPYEDTKVASSLIDKPLQGSKIVKTTALPQFNAVEWTLANHTKVVYRQADYEKDNVILRGISAGGNSLLPVDKLASAMMMPQFMSMFGVGTFDATTLKKMLTGKNVSLNVGLSQLNESFSGSAAPKDFETLMQLLYLQFENPRFDKDAFQALKGRFAGMVASLANNPQKVMSDSLQLILSNHNKRTKLISPALIEELSVEQMENIYKDRFADAGDFTFFIVGNIEEAKVKPLVEKYIGSLKDLPRVEKWKDNNIEGPKGKTVREITMPMQIKKATVVVNYNEKANFDPRSNILMSVLKGVLNLRYLEEIREKEGGTYGVSVMASSEHFPKAEKNLQMMFDAEPERSAYLKSILYREIDKIVANGPTAEDLDKVIKNLQKDREQNKLHNAYWMGTLTDFYQHKINNDAPENFEKILPTITRDEVKKFAAGFFKKADLVDVVFLPSKK
ncbi:MAG: insulinase family protein [Marinilabiliales bacterium]|nr:insulinase family protein [Marinilabiliales bacterium]